jgi:two-component system sensor kinase FixL
VRRLRASARKDTPKRERCDLAEVVRAAASLLEVELRSAGVALHLDLDPGAPPVEVDTIQLEQVVLNLLRNAFDAILSGPPGPHVIHLKTMMAGQEGGVEVCVRDDGPGLPVEDVAKLLEPFFTTKRQGLGMGLSISQRIIEAHGGTLRGFSNPEGGATFAFTLPACGRPVEG